MSASDAPIICCMLNAVREHNIQSNICGRESVCVCVCVCVVVVNVWTIVCFLCEGRLSRSVFVHGLGRSLVEVRSKSSSAGKMLEFY